MRVKDILTLDTFNGSKLISGSLGLNSRVKNTTFIDAPDGYYWCKKGDFILTTGYPFINENLEKDLRRLIDNLVAKEVTAIGLKIGRYIPYIPEGIISYADEVNLPIISLPNNIPWADMIVSVITHINQKNMIELEKTHNVYEKFQDYLNQNIKVNTIPDFLTSIIEYDVSVHFNNFNKLYNSRDVVFTREEAEEFVDRKFDEKNEPIQKTRYNGKECTVKWISSSSKLEGVIIIWGKGFLIDAWRRAAIEQAAAIISFEIERLRSFMLTFQQFRNKFIEDLISKKMEFNVMVRKAKELEWKINDSYSLVLIEIGNGTENNYIKKMRIKEKVVEVLNRDFIKFSTEILIGFDDKNQLVLFLSEKHSKKDSLMKIKQILSDLNLKKVFIGIGQKHDVTSIKESYKEAKLALQVLMNTENKSKLKDVKIQYFDELRVDRIIHSHNPQEEIKKLFDQYLTGVYEHDRARDTDLILTLRTFIDNNTNYEKTSKELFVHKNTVRYRINIVEKIIKLDLKDNNNILFLQLLLTSID